MTGTYVVALAIGVVGSTVIHLSQGLMRWGIQLKRRSEDDPGPGRRVWIVGVALNFTAPLWVILANRFGPTTLYTSMYAVGLIVLLAFSRWKLDRVIHPLEVWGALLLIGATALLGIDGMRGPPVSMGQVPAWPLLTLGAVALVLIWPLGILTRHAPRLPTGLLFGALGGTFLALDSLLKGVAQFDTGSAAFLPGTAAGWTLFLLSFVGAGAALGMTQWAHLRSAPPSQTIAGYDAFYVAIPILLVPSMVALPEAGISLLCWSGLAGISAGLMLILKGQRSAAN